MWELMLNTFEWISIQINSKHLIHVCVKCVLLNGVNSRCLDHGISRTSFELQFQSNLFG